MDIQGCTSKHGAVAYIAKYITRRLSKSGTPEDVFEKQIDERHARAQEDGMGDKADLVYRPNGQVSPGVMCLMEVCRMNIQL